MGETRNIMITRNGKQGRQATDLKKSPAYVIVAEKRLEVSTGQGETDKVFQIQVLHNIRYDLPWQATNGHDAGDASRLCGVLGTKLALQGKRRENAIRRRALERRAGQQQRAQKYAETEKRSVKMRLKLSRGLVSQQARSGSQRLGWMVSDSGAIRLGWAGGWAGRR